MNIAWANFTWQSVSIGGGLIGLAAALAAYGQFAAVPPIDRRLVLGSAVWRCD